MWEYIGKSFVVSLVHRKTTHMVFDLYWLADAHPAPLVLPPQQDGGEHAIEKHMGQGKDSDSTYQLLLLS